MSTIERDSYQYTLGAKQAAQQLHQRLIEAGLDPDYEAIVAAFVQECTEEHAAATAPLYAPWGLRPATDEAMPSYSVVYIAEAPAPTAA